MTAMRWQTFGEFGSEFERLQNEVDRLFGRRGALRWLTPAVYPPLNVREDENSLIVEAELPGLELEDLEIYVSGANQLTIKGERKAPAKEDGTWHRRERSSGRFSRELQLPEDVDSEGVVAEFKHGVLTVTLPKREEVKPRRIEVQAR